MAPRCTICAHPQRRKIDRALIADGVPNRAVARQFGLSPSAVDRHRQNHLAPRLATAAKREQAANLTTAGGIIGELSEVHGEAKRILREAKRDDDRRVQLAAIARVEKQLELAARLIDLINDSPNVSVQVQVDTWPSIRVAILTALEEFPDARIAVVEALEEVGR